MTYKETVDIQVFTCQGGNYITNKQVVSNVVTLTTLTPHGYVVGDKVWLGAVDTVIQTNMVTTVTVTAVPTSTTFTFSRTTADMASTAVLPYGNVYKLQTWTKPAGAVLVKFTLCGAGGGGGSGARQATTSNRTGGSGGGGGGWQEVTIPASEVPATAIFLTVPNGGYGGLSITTDSTAGMTGGAGGGGTATRVTDVEIAYTNAHLALAAVSGNGGLGGGTGTTVAGGLGGGNTQFGGGAGGPGNNTTGSVGANATFVGAGGGGGGGAAANSTTAAAGGGAPTLFAVRNISGTFVTPGNGTTTMDSTTNTSYYPVKAGLPGISGGGGAYKTATNGGNGGNATNYNAGGGGGGASDNGFTSGAGGRGADGCVVITTYF